MASSGLGSLYVGVTGLRTASNAINTTANNLANVNTTGYVRQQVLQADAVYRTVDMNQAISLSRVGIGVDIAEVIHTRDEFLDRYYRTETGRQSFYQTLTDTIDEVETIFQEMEGQQFQLALTDFEQAFEEIAKDPSDSVYQNLVIQKATLFLSRAQDVMKSLTDYQENINQRVEDMVFNINQIGQEIATLNKQIAKIEAGNIETAYDLRDERDNLLDELSEYVKIEYKELNDHTVSVTIEGTEFVEGARMFKMGTVGDESSGYRVPMWTHLSNISEGEIKYLYNLENGFDTVRNTDIGSLKALLISRGDEEANYVDSMGDELRELGIELETISELTDNSIIMTVQSQLDTLVHAIVTDVNEVFSPTIEINESNPNVYQAGNGNYVFTGKDDMGNNVRIVSKNKIRIWDEENGPVGSDDTAPGRELFTRLFTDRYTKLTGKDGKTYYVYNEENYEDSTTVYTLKNLQVNQVLAENCTYLPFHKKNGDVDYDMGTALAALFTNPSDALDGITYAEYYNALINNVADLGNIYSGTANSLSSTVATLENKRQEIIGVSSDEELSNLIRYQSAYNASSRYINVVDEMVEVLVTQLI